MNDHIRYFGGLLVLAVIVFSFQYVASVPPSTVESTLTAAVSPAIREQLVEHFRAQQRLQPFIPPDDITANAILFGDMATGQIIAEREAVSRFPIASITKVMTAYVALRESHQDDLVTITAHAIRTEGPSGDLRVGETFFLKDIVTLMIVESSNDAATAIAEHIGAKYGGESPAEHVQLFVELMNDYALELGMRGTVFQNPTGLDIGVGKPSNLSTAADLFKLAIATQEYPLIWDGSRYDYLNITSETGIVHVAQNTNTIAKNIHHLIGSKTGTTLTAGESNLLLFEQPLGKPKILILLGMPFGSREEQIFRFIERIPTVG